MRDWHEARAELIARAIEAELGPDGVGAFLVWGDPSVYDSMLRITERVRALGVVEFALTVIPGVTSVQALAAAHQIALMLKVRVVLLLPEAGTITVKAGYPPEDILDEADIAAAKWAWENDRSAGRGSDVS